MKRILKYSFIFIACLILHACHLLGNKLGRWEIVYNAKSSDSISWARFYWVNDTVDHRYVEKIAMFVPAKLPGLPHRFNLQFDLGSDLTILYGNSIKSVYSQHPELNNNIKALHMFGLEEKAEELKDFNIDFGAFKAHTANCYVKSDYGDSFSVSPKDDTTDMHIGSIGVDMFKNKVLIIDYPNQRFAVCESVPEAFNGHFIDIELDKSGMIILPMKIRDKNYRIMFDNGSSLFPIITLAKNITNFSNGKVTDSMEITSWGKKHYVTGRMITDTFELAGMKFHDVKVYANHSGYGIDDATDGMTGNILFWDKTIIIDFKNKKFGIR